MALGVNSVGFLGKMFSDIIESVDPGPGEALRPRPGATPVQQLFRRPLIPQVTPDSPEPTCRPFPQQINLRAASIPRAGRGRRDLAGAVLIQRIQFRRWEEISMILIIIIAFVVVVDVLSSFIRRRLV
ncbi:MAG: hypothetical protein U5L04_02750 [Trueperaceae bacterium]|nr:hypothetical protein [Trueperaceae bacterium]